MFMNLKFDNGLIKNYHSGAQIARVLTENWVNHNMYCPRCGNSYVSRFENNRPVADFYCPVCNNQYELKSKNGALGHKINDGAYNTMISRIKSNNNPDFFFMSYSREEMKVNDFIFIPKHFFVPEIIEKRKPLAQTARRARWVGCNILIDKIPEQGKINIVSNGELINIDSVLSSVSKSNALEIKDIYARGWLLDVLTCVNKISSPVFTLEEMYRFENSLHIKHPQNNNIKPKIRQQLQVLRDKGFIEFLGCGKYKKIL